VMSHQQCQCVANGNADLVGLLLGIVWGMASPDFVNACSSLVVVIASSVRDDA
jgi:hypothetical protein